MSVALAELELSCADCGAHLKVAAAHPNANIRCPGCRSVFPLAQARRRRPVASATTAGVPPPRQAPQRQPAPVRPPLTPLAPTPAAEWRLRERSGESSLSAQALEDRVRDGRARAADEVIAPGASQWTALSEVPQFKTAMALRMKEVESRLRSLARKEHHHCSQHANRRALYVCLTCAYPLCGGCVLDGRCLACESKVVTL